MNNNSSSEITLRKLQMEMLEMLKLFDRICRKYDIKYSLFAGSLLGAVRHKGFIPWDDDLDVAMLRSEYDRFLEVWKQEQPEGYFLQNKDIESAYTRSFSKIRKNHTVFLQDGEKPEKMHTGIFIDIFPIDRIPEKKVTCLFYYWNCIRYQLYHREFIPTKSNILIKSVAWILLSTSNSKSRELKRKRILKKIVSYNKNREWSLACIETIKMMKLLQTADAFDNYTYMEFEGENFMCIEKWDEFLVLWYDNYMQLPGVEERIWKHRPLMLDLENDYRGYINKNCVR